MNSHIANYLLELIFLYFYIGHIKNTVFAKHTNIKPTYFKDLKLNFSDPMTINEDNQSAICIAKDSGNHAKAKHIRIKHHFIRDFIHKNINKDKILLY